MHIPEGGLENLAYKADSRHAAQIYKEYGDFIWCIIRARINDIGLAEDLYQSFFLSIVAKPIPENVENMKPYLFRMVTNQICSSFRKNQKYYRNVKKFEDFSKFPTHKTDPQSVLIYREEMKKLFSVARQHLSLREQKVLFLRYRDGCNIEEIAKVIGTRKSTVRKYISVAMDKIRKVMKNDEK